MIMFYSFLFFLLAPFILNLLRVLINFIDLKFIRKSVKNYPLISAYKNCMFGKIPITSIVISILIFSLFCIIPNLLQENDIYLIKLADKNIELLNSYIDEYTEAAQKQISEWQKAQSEMAKIATSTQLQFWSQQIDSVGNSLTNKIKDFKEKIVTQQIEQNKAKISLETRPNSRWFFGIM